MTALEITVERHYLDWPLGQTINQQDLKQQLGVYASGANGANLTDQVLVNLTQVNVNQPGEYPVVLSILDAAGNSAQAKVTLNVRSMRHQESVVPSSKKKVVPQAKKKHPWLIALFVILVILCIWWGVSAHNKAQQAQTANNSEQSSQISNNSSSIEKLSSDNQKLANQVAELKGAVQQYQKDQDQQALDQRLTKIENRNQQLQNQVQNNSTKTHLNEVTEVVEQVRQDPDNGVQIVNHLKNESGFKDIWNNITSQVQQWLARFAN